MKVLVEMSGTPSNSIMARDRRERTDTKIEVVRNNRDEAIFSAITTLYMLGGASLQRYIEDRLDLIGQISGVMRMARLPEENAKEKTGQDAKPDLEEEEEDDEDEEP